jgi:uncharacterized membrane protein
MTGSPQAGTASPTTATRTRPSRRPRWRNLLLTVHIVVAVGVLGTDLVLLTLGVTGLVSRDPELVRAAYLAMGLLAEAVLLPLALAAPLTGILLGLGTAWGLARHAWVLTKLVLTIAVATTAVFVLRPALNRAAAQALQVPLAELPTAGIGQLGVAVTLAPAGALGVLVAIVTLAVFKPWGQTRFRASLTRGHQPTRPRS